jgi:hypothetical protein
VVQVRPGPSRTRPCGFARLVFIREGGTGYSLGFEKQTQSISTPGSDGVILGSWVGSPAQPRRH